MPDSPSVGSFHDKLRQEQLMIMERGAKIEERKIIFVIGLLGIAGVNVFIGPGASEQSVSASLPNWRHIWYLAPFVAVFFDALGLLQKYSVRRIGAFLRDNSPDAMEMKWEDFVTNHRDRFLRFEAAGFTLLTFASSFWMIYRYIHDGNIASIHPMEWAWFSLLVVISFAVWIHATLICNALNESNRLSASN